MMLMSENDGKQAISAKSVVLVAVLLVIAISTCVWVFLQPRDEPSAEKRDVAPVTLVKGAEAKSTKARLLRNRKQNVNEHKVAKRPRKPQPDLVMEAEEEAALTELQRELIREIRKALDADNRKEMIRLVQRMQRLEEWPDGIPAPIKRMAISALSWFGAECVPELAGFLADGDPEIVQMTIDEYQNALSDITLSDREISQILVSACKVIQDADSLDAMMMSLNEMRHSVGAQTIVDIMDSGNKAALSVLQSNIDFFTGEEGLDSVEKLEQWLSENPDDEDDEEFYGGWKDS